MIQYMAGLSNRQLKLNSLFGNDRDIEVLSRTLARKMLLEENVDLPPAVLAEISGVSEAAWIKTYKDGKSFIFDLINEPVLEALSMLQALEVEERSFMDKLRKILSLIYTINYNYPELMVLFNKLMQEGVHESAGVLLKTAEEMHYSTSELLKKQAYEEGLLEKGSTMESLLFFLIHQILDQFQMKLLSCCEAFVKTKNHTAFPDEEEMISQFMSPICDQLEGIIAT